MRFAPRVDFTLFKEIPPMVGHSGASGAVLYYVPALDLYVSGTVNQIKQRSSPTTCWRGSAWRARRRGEGGPVLFSREKHAAPLCEVSLQQVQGLVADHGLPQLRRQVIQQDHRDAVVSRPAELSPGAIADGEAAARPLGA